MATQARSHVCGLVFFLVASPACRFGSSTANKADDCEVRHITHPIRWRKVKRIGTMLPAAVVQAIIRSLDVLAERVLRPGEKPRHHRTGRRGEEDAYFHLRKLGYKIVARNFRTPRCRGEIDLIAWDGDVLCFIEVKTRTSKAVKTAVAAVDQHKRREMAQVAREYRRQLPPTCQWRIDIVSVYYDGNQSRAQIEVFRNASLAA